LPYDRPRDLGPERSSGRPERAQEAAPLLGFQSVVGSQDDEEGARLWRRVDRLDGEAPSLLAEQGRETERECSASRCREPLRAMNLGSMVPAEEQPGINAVIRSVFVAQ
jgi:hypothetical protein